MTRITHTVNHSQEITTSPHRHASWNLSTDIGFFFWGNWANPNRPVRDSRIYWSLIESMMFCRIDNHSLMACTVINEISIIIYKTLSLSELPPEPTECVSFWKPICAKIPSPMTLRSISSPPARVLEGVVRPTVSGWVTFEDGFLDLVTESGEPIKIWGLSPGLESIVSGCDPSLQSSVGVKSRAMLPANFEIMINLSINEIQWRNRVKNACVDDVMMCQLEIENHLNAYSKSYQSLTSANLKLLRLAFPANCFGRQWINTIHEWMNFAKKPFKKFVNKRSIIEMLRNPEFQNQKCLPWNQLIAANENVMKSGK